MSAPSTPPVALPAAAPVKGRNQPAGGNDRTDAWNGEEAEPGQRAERATRNGANPGAGAGCFGAIILAIQLAVRIVDRKPDGIVVVHKLSPFRSVRRWDRSAARR